jgi:outer membrane biogenesis lipoprotein LolB
MKNFFLFIVIAFLTSCSKNEDKPSENNNPVLLKKSISTSSTGIPRTTDYVYDGNKIVSATTNTFKVNYFYTNDLISKIEFTYN